MLLANLQHKRWVLVTTRDTDRNIKPAGVKTLSIIGSILNETEFRVRQDAQEELFLSNHDIIRSAGIRGPPQSGETAEHYASLGPHP
jgi:hypothetical protein